MNQPEPFGPYVHMGPADKILWRRWLDAGGSKLAPFQYDTRVGAGLQMPDGSTRLQREIAYIETAKRVDAIAYTQEPAIIFEVKPRAGTTAVGQLITYGDLWHQDNPFRSRPRLWLITDRLQPDIGFVLTKNGLQLTELDA